MTTKTKPAERKVYAFWFGDEIVAQTIATSIEEARERAVDFATLTGTIAELGVLLRGSCEVSVAPIRS